MKVDELIQQSQIVTDYNGNKRSVLLDYSVWEELLETLASDAETEPARSHEKVESKPKDGDKEQDRSWITEAANKVAAEVDTSLDPAIYAMQRTWLPKEDWSEARRNMVG